MRKPKAEKNDSFFKFVEKVQEESKIQADNEPKEDDEDENLKKALRASELEAKKEGNFLKEMEKAKAES